MGLFDDYDIDMDEVKEAGGFDFKDGFYDFEISEALKQQGTKNDPDDTKFIIKYDFDEDGTYWEWFTIAVDGDANHPKAKQSLGYLKARLLDLGIPASQLNELEPEDLEGIRGSLELRTTNGKGKNSAKTYQNVRNVKVEGDAPEAVAEPVEDTKAADAAAKKRVAARQAARSQAEAPAERPARRRAAAPAADEDSENPFA